MRCCGNDGESRSLSLVIVWAQKLRESRCPAGLGMTADEIFKQRGEVYAEIFSRQEPVRPSSPFERSAQDKSDSLRMTGFGG